METIYKVIIIISLRHLCAVPLLFSNQLIKYSKRVYIRRHNIGLGRRVERAGEDPYRPKEIKYKIRAPEREEKDYISPF
jgi:hypothetical protein